MSLLYAQKFLFLTLSLTLEQKLLKEEMAQMKNHIKMKLKNYIIPHIVLHTNILTGYVRMVLWFLFHKITKNHPQDESNFSKAVLNSQTLLLKAMHGKR